MNPRIRRLRKQLLTLPEYTRLPKCEFCQGQFPAHDFRRHAKACERDAASQCIAALDRAIAVLWATEGRDEARFEQLRQERSAAYDVLIGVGRVRTAGRGYPHDGMPC